MTFESIQALKECVEILPDEPISASVAAMQALKSCNIKTLPVLNGGAFEMSPTEADLANRFSTKSIAMFTSKILFDEHVAYTIETIGGDTIIVLNTHFIRELRRQLSGDVIASEFSPYEELTYQRFQDWSYSLYVLEGIDLAIMLAIDFWLVEEIQNHLHPEITRTYTNTHKWRKTDERID